ncbi:hypothetical protein OF83DRAFT_1073137, partial [Amylostereum chailletii]
MDWCASLTRKVQPKTIKQYIMHVRSAHIEQDLPFSVMESPRLQRLIQGIKQVHGEKDCKLRLPVTLDILLRILPNI